MKLNTVIFLVLTVSLLIPGTSAAQDPNDLHISELEQKVLQLWQVALALKEDIGYLKAEIKEDKNVVADYGKANEKYNSIVNEQEIYDLSASPVSAADISRFRAARDRLVKEADIILSNGRKFENHLDLEAYLEQSEKNLPVVKQRIEELTEVLRNAQAYYKSTMLQQNEYRDAYTERCSRLAIVGLWKFQGRQTILKISYMDHRYRAVIVDDEDEIECFEKGDVLFTLNRADIQDDPYYYIGLEKVMGIYLCPHKSRLKPTSIRVSVDINTNQMHYKSKDQHLILNKIKEPNEQRGTTFFGQPHG